MGYIYKITNKVNNKVYIGQTIRTIEERYKKHLFEARRHTNRPLYDSMNHYGYDNFEVELVVEAPNDRLNELEVFYISKYDATNPDRGYNLTTGGDTFRCCIPEDKKRAMAEKVSKALKGRKQPQELIDKRATKLRGKKRTAEQRQRFSDAQKKRDLNTFARGFTVPQERRDKISASLIGQVQTEETKLKRKESISKLKWWNNGVDCVRAAECPEGYVAGRINFAPSAESKAKSSHKGTKWFTNGKENKMAYECPEGFWPGKTFKKDLIK